MDKALKALTNARTETPEKTFSMSLLEAIIASDKDLVRYSTKQHNEKHMHKDTVDKQQLLPFDRYGCVLVKLCRLRF